MITEVESDQEREFLKDLHSKRILDPNLLGDSHIAGGETEVAYLRFLRE